MLPLRCCLDKSRSANVKNASTLPCVIAFGLNIRCAIEARVMLLLDLSRLLQHGSKVCVSQCLPSHTSAASQQAYTMTAEATINRRPACGMVSGLATM